MSKHVCALPKNSREDFRVGLDGEAVQMRFEGDRPPDPAQVRPLLALLDLVRQNKDAVRYFLHSFCPRCGCCCFVPDYEGRGLCLACDWVALVTLYPGLGEIQ